MKEAVFSLNETLKKGLALTINPRNHPYLIKSIGAFPFEEALQSVEQFDPVDTSSLGALSFPYPQLFVCSDCTIVCTPTAIYEYASPLVLKISGLPEGVTWTCIDYKNFIYLSNCAIAVIKNPQTGQYAIAPAQYIPCRAGCDYFGQVVLSPCPDGIDITFSPIPVTGGGIVEGVPAVGIVIPLDNYWQQGIDPGDDGYVTASALKRSGEGMVFFQEEISTENNTYYDYFDSFPKIIDGFNIANVIDLPPCARRENDFQFVVFVVQAADYSYGVFIDIYRNSTLSTGLIFEPAIDDFDYAFYDGNMAEGYDDGVVVVAYLTSTTIDPGTPGEYYENQIHIKRSTDYGLTWADTIIHNADYDSTEYNTPTLIKGQDGNLYILGDISIEVDYSLFGYSWTSGQRVYFIAKSTDKGLNWTFKVVHTYDPLIDGWDTIDNQHICASDDTIYVGTAPRVLGSGGLNTVIIYSSTDGGDNWTAYQHDEFGSYVTISCHGANLLFNCGVKIYKSIDNGLTFSEVYTIPQLVYYCLMRSEGSVFAFTGCGLSDASIERELTWFLSIDDGDNWVQKKFNIYHEVI